MPARPATPPRSSRWRSAGAAQARSAGGQAACAAPSLHMLWRDIWRARGPGRGSLPLLLRPLGGAPAATAARARAIAALRAAVGVAPGTRSDPLRASAYWPKASTIGRNQLLWNPGRAPWMYQRRPPHAPGLAAVLRLPSVARRHVAFDGRPSDPRVEALSRKSFEGLCLAGRGRAARRRAVLPLLRSRGPAAQCNVRRGGWLRRGPLPLRRGVCGHDRRQRGLRRPGGASAPGSETHGRHRLFPQRPRTGPAVHLEGAPGLVGGDEPVPQRRGRRGLLGAPG
mmetsp:Transcript_114396/g.364692  ORF Transcript_114396/g.364692 Transcript_114396/m.364692 type:complete len:283 (-) Transcript_114396:498-1346(-)